MNLFTSELKHHFAVQQRLPSILAGVTSTSNFPLSFRGAAYALKPTALRIAAWNEFLADYLDRSVWRR